MLHKNPLIVSPEIINLIQELQSFPQLKEFYLVGGTALALQLGHRNSIDIDLFSISDFETSDLINLIKSRYVFEELFIRKNTIIGVINHIKVDFISHPYRLVKPPITEEGITFLSMEDIAAMKMHAIVNSGQRLKDFIDIYFLLEHFSIKQMLHFYEAKYEKTNPLIALKAITFFGDIDESVDQPKMKKKISLEKIKSRIHEAVDHSTKIFKK